MKLPRLFRKRQMRGKSKSPEQKFKEKKAMVDSFLLDAWLKRLKQDPTLADRISEQRYGSEGMRYESDEYEGGGGDLLGVLRQAREAKDLLKDEISTKGSWLSDLAQIMKALPGVLGSLPQLQQAVQQQQQPNPTKHIQQIEVGHDQPQPQPQHLELSMSMEVLMPLIVLEASEALEQLRVNNEQGWLQYLSRTSVEEFEAVLAQYAKDCEIPEIAEGINDFLQKRHHWISELVELAHNAGQNKAKHDKKQAY